MTAPSAESVRKAQIDAVLLKLPGVSARKINGLDAYFVSDRMFACISGDGAVVFALDSEDELPQHPRR